MVPRLLWRNVLAAASVAIPFLVLVPAPVAAAPDDVVGDACTEGDTSGVDIDSFFFSPTPLTVDVGDVVEWTNINSVTQHTTTENYVADNTPARSVAKLIDPPLWDSGPLAPAGGSFSVQFCAAGTYEYHCDIHPVMRGTVVVE